MSDQYYLGIDWSEDKHDICLLNPSGEVVIEKEIPHSVEGFAQIEEIGAKAKIAREALVIGIETANTLLIDWLWGQSYEQLYVVAPTAVEKSRERFHASGAKDDELDAHEIADLVRLERKRLWPWHPGSELLQQMRAQVSFSLYLTKSCVATSNRLQSLLLRYYPAALRMCASWPTQLVCHWLMVYPDPRQVSSLSYAQFKAFALEHDYPHPKELLACFDRLQADYPKARPAVIDALAPEALTLATMLLANLRYKAENIRQLNVCFQQHPDAALFASLPGAGDLLAPALLVKFGEDRARFPHAWCLQALAGACPVTVKSGKRRVVFFRRACDHEFRYIAQQWAFHSRLQSDWANTYFQQLFARSGKRQLALRCLANRWLAIAWRCWQDHTPYDEARHLQQRSLRRLPKSHTISWA